MDTMDATNNANRTRTIYRTGEAQAIIAGREEGQRRKVEQERERAERREAEREANRKASQERADTAAAARIARDRERIAYDAKTQFMRGGGTSSEWERDSERLVREAVERERQAAEDRARRNTARTVRSIF